MRVHCRSQRLDGELTVRNSGIAGRVTLQRDYTNNDIGREYPAYSQARQLA